MKGGRGDETEKITSQRERRLREQANHLCTLSEGQVAEWLRKVVWLFEINRRKKAREAKERQGKPAEEGLVPLPQPTSPR